MWLLFGEREFVEISFVELARRPLGITIPSRRAKTFNDSSVELKLTAQKSSPVAAGPRACRSGLHTDRQAGTPARHIIASGRGGSPHRRQVPLNDSAIWPEDPPRRKGLRHRYRPNAPALGGRIPRRQYFP